MNRKSDRKYVIQAQARKAQLFDYQNRGYRLSENKELPRENRPFLDVLNYQMGVFLRQTKQSEKKRWTFIITS
jgi:hypothetical protein